MANPLLKRGMRDNEYVRYAQRLLWDGGYYQGEMDGDFGPLTEQAVERFQEDYRRAFSDMLVDGKIGRQTWFFLERDFGSGAAPVEPVPHTDEFDTAAVALPDEPMRRYGAGLMHGYVDDAHQLANAIASLPETWSWFVGTEAGSAALDGGEMIAGEALFSGLAGLAAPVLSAVLMSAAYWTEIAHIQAAVDASARRAPILALYAHAVALELGGSDGGSPGNELERAAYQHALDILDNLDADSRACLAAHLVYYVGTPSTADEYSRYLNGTTFYNSAIRQLQTMETMTH